MESNRNNKKNKTKTGGTVAMGKCNTSHVRRDQLKKIKMLMTSPAPADIMKEHDKLIKKIEDFNRKCKQIGKDLVAKDETIKEIKDIMNEGDIDLFSYGQERLMFVQKPQDMLISIETASYDRGFNDLVIMPLGRVKDSYSASDTSKWFQQLTVADHGIENPHFSMYGIQDPWWKKMQIKFR